MLIISKAVETVKLIDIVPFKERARDVNRHAKATNNQGLEPKFSGKSREFK